ncbi:unnamed protein product [Alopecurus aequalis]
MAKPGWSELPIDLLILVLHLLQLPEALAFRAVCPLWRLASMTAAGLPRTRRTPWLVSLVTDEGTPSVSSKFRTLLDQTKTYRVSLPRGKAMALCGASHGWLVVANELSDLVLYDPFAMTTIPLPPITTFSKCIQGVYDRQDHHLKGYRYSFYLGGATIQDVVSTGRYFYDKVVLSGAPSTGGAVALAVHVEGTRLSFAKVGGTSWQQVSTVKTGSGDSFADIVHHRGMFYAVTMKGMLVSLNYCGWSKPKKETIIAEHDDDNLSHVITRYLVSTPWGHLLQVRVILDRNRENYVRVEIGRVDFKSRKMVGLNPTEALRGHSVFLGQNSPGVLSTHEFPGLRQNCIYFTTPRLRNEVTYGHHYNGWSGVQVYDLRRQTLEVAFLSGRGYYGPIHPHIWF